MSQQDDREAWETHLENKELAKAARKDRAVAAKAGAFDVFVALCEAHGLPAPVREYEFAKPRKFRADYCWPDAKVIVEKNGGIWQKGGHSSGTGLLRDYEKSNIAQLGGWLFLVYTPRDLESGSPLATLKILLERRGVPQHGV